MKTMLVTTTEVIRWSSNFLGGLRNVKRGNKEEKFWKHKNGVRKVLNVSFPLFVLTPALYVCVFSQAKASV